jgi:hypothetical protein
MNRMGLFKKIFGNDDKTGQPAQQSSQFQDSDDSTDQAGSKNAKRRELVHVVLRDTVRNHGIPSDWIECRILSVVSRRGVNGMHVQLVVRDGHDRLLAYVPAFQASYMDAIDKFDSHAADWLLSLSWQFDTSSAGSQRRMPDPGTWGAAPAAAAGADTSVPADLTDFVSTQDEDVEADLKALYAIRDAAMKDDPLPEAGQKDFQETRPGG